MLASLTQQSLTCAHTSVLFSCASVQTMRRPSRASPRAPREGCGPRGSPDQLTPAHLQRVTRMKVCCGVVLLILWLFVMQHHCGHSKCHPSLSYYFSSRPCALPALCSTPASPSHLVDYYSRRTLQHSLPSLNNVQGLPIPSRVLHLPACQWGPSEVGLLRRSKVHRALSSRGLLPARCGHPRTPALQLCRSLLRLYH